MSEAGLDVVSGVSSGRSSCVKIADVRFSNFLGTPWRVGCLFIDNVFFSFSESGSRFEYQVRYKQISSCDMSKMQENAYITVVRRDFAILSFFISKVGDAEKVLQHMRLKCKIERLEDHLAFVNPLNYEMSVPQSFGWTIYNKEMEFHRLSHSDDTYYESSPINSLYKLCPTYPDILFVPRQAANRRNILYGSAKYRSLGRLPVLSYLCIDKNSVLVRCSQPLAGLYNKSFDDVLLLKLFNESCPKPGKTMCIFDARPMINALANRAKGKGYENLRDYGFCSCEFLDIPNIHVIRDCLNKYLSAVRTCQNMYSTYYQAISSSGWLKNILTILNSARHISMRMYDDETNCVIHCSDGWDRTSQLCALVGIILNPFYRTQLGFMILIEKEFVSFGHKFADRNGMLSGDQREVSPIVSQFLDCVYQLTQLFPLEFQFNERFLYTIHYHVFSGQFGTFLSNSESERKHDKLPERTDSLWNYMLSNSQLYENPFHQPIGSVPLFRKNLLMVHMKVWKYVYCRDIHQLYEVSGFHMMAESLKEKKIMTKILNNRENSKDTPPRLVTWEAPWCRQECSCEKLFDHIVEPIQHCWVCGNVFCKACLSVTNNINYCRTCAKLTSLTESQ